MIGVRIKHHLLVKDQTWLRRERSNPGRGQAALLPKEFHVNCTEIEIWAARG